MDMIRHYHVSADWIISAEGPSLANQFVDPVVRQNLAAIFCTDGQEQNDRLKI
jgi:hypothetical protein